MEGMREYLPAGNNPMSDEENPPRNSAIASEHYPLTNRSTANELENAYCNLSQWGLNCSTRERISIIEEFREENDANQMRATTLTRELNHAAISRDFKLKTARITSYNV